MLTLYHASQSRSGIVLALIYEMGIENEITIKEVNIPRQDGSGGADEANPHPEKKVPALDHDGAIITERAAIFAHLASLFPERAAPKIATPEWGKYLSWIIWYQDVMESVYFLEMAGIEHPAITRNFRGRAEAEARLKAALDEGPWLMGNLFTGADYLVASMLQFAPQFMPEDDKIQDWYQRVTSRPAWNKM